MLFCVDKVICVALVALLNSANSPLASSSHCQSPFGGGMDGNQNRSQFKVFQSRTDTKEQSRSKFPKSQPDASVLKLRCSRPGQIHGGKTQGIIITRRMSEGFFQTLRQTQKLNPSLTQRVGTVANAQLQNASARDRCLAEKSHTHVSGCDFSPQ
jgi:hypothetical protein